MRMNHADLKRLVLPAVALALFAQTPTAQSQVIYSDFGDGMLEARGSTEAGSFDTDWPKVWGTGDWQGTVGEWYGTGPDSPPDSSTYGLTTLVLPFALPNVGAVANPFLSADLGVMLNPNTGDANFTDIDLYGLSRVDASPAVFATDWYNGASPDAGAALIQSSFLTPSSPQGWNGAPNNNTDATGDVNLLNFLNSAYAGGANAGNFVFLRLSYGSDTFATAQDNFNITLRDAGQQGEWPVITYSAVPEPATASLFALGTLVLLGYRSRRNG